MSCADSPDYNHMYVNNTVDGVVRGVVCLYCGKKRKRAPLKPLFKDSTVIKSETDKGVQYETVHLPKEE